MIMNTKQGKIKIETRIKLNYNIDGFYLITVAAYILTYLIQPTHYQQFPIFIHYFKQTFIKPNFVTPLKKYFNIFKRTPIRYNNLSSDFLTTRTFCWDIS